MNLTSIKGDVTILLKNRKFFAKNNSKKIFGEFMKAKKIQKTTTNRTEFNRAYKRYLEHTGKIRCSYCKYNRGENKTTRDYGGFDKDNLKKPNWKLVSKNRKQWMKKPIRCKNTGIRNNYYEIIW